MSATKVDTKVLEQRVRELAGVHNGYRQLGGVLGYDHAYLYRLGRGERTEPGDELLKKLGLRRVVSFERIEPRNVGVRVPRQPKENDRA